MSWWHGGVGKTWFQQWTSTLSAAGKNDHRIFVGIVSKLFECDQKMCQKTSIWENGALKWETEGENEPMGGRTGANWIQNAIQTGGKKEPKGGPVGTISVICVRTRSSHGLSFYEKCHLPLSNQFLPLPNQFLPLPNQFLPLPNYVFFLGNFPFKDGW